MATNKHIIQLEKAITIESPTNTEDISFFYTDVAITIQEIIAVCVGTTPSVTYTIRHSTDRNATGNEVVTSGSTTTSTTTGDSVTSFNDATIPADSFVWLETTAESGTITSLSVNVRFTND
jgi:acyl-CoA reductase-like NAD-dependent aldehyde dehydrogenase